MFLYVSNNLYSAVKWYLKKKKIIAKEMFVIFKKNSQYVIK